MTGMLTTCARPVRPAARARLGKSVVGAHAGALLLRVGQRHVLSHSTPLTNRDVTDLKVGTKVAVPR
jgi:hypothetical protein